MRPDVSDIRCALFGAVITILTSSADAAQDALGWPDVILCKKQADIEQGKATKQIFLYVSHTNSLEKQGAPNYGAYYYSVHFHDASGSLSDNYIMIFDGPSVDQAIALAVPKDTLDCPPGITIARLREQAQTRNFGH
jgi:hypothetical protein